MHLGKPLSIVLIGECYVGKSSIVQRYVDGYSSDKVKCTIPADMKKVYYPFKNSTVELNIWDTSGQEQYQSMTPCFYRRAHGVVVTYAISDRYTFEEVDKWINEMRLSCKSCVLIIVGNKCDKTRDVSIEEGKQLAKKHGAQFFETSAITGQGIKEVFDKMVNEILDHPEIYDASEETVELSEMQSTPQQESSFCC